MSVIPPLFRRCPALCLPLWQDFPAPKPPPIHPPLSASLAAFGLPEALEAAGGGVHLSSVSTHQIAFIECIKTYQNRQNAIQQIQQIQQIQHQIPTAPAGLRQNGHVAAANGGIHGQQLQLQQLEPHDHRPRSARSARSAPGHPCGAPWHQTGGLAESEWSPADGPPKQPWLQVLQTLILSFNVIHCHSMSFIVIHIVFVWHCSCCGTDY